MDLSYDIFNPVVHSIPPNQPQIIPLPTPDHPQPILPKINDYTKEDLINKLEFTDESSKEEFLSKLDQFLRDANLIQVKTNPDGTEEINKNPIVSESNTVINTDSIYAETTTGKCSICEEQLIRQQELEREKMSLEIKRMRASLLEKYIISGYVRTDQGDVVENVNIIIEGVHGLNKGIIYDQDVTDEFGFYSLGTNKILKVDNTYKLYISKLPERFENMQVEVFTFVWNGENKGFNFTIKENI
jgi:hypothetical protein